jgi:hypothetical protein
MSSQSWSAKSWAKWRLLLHRSVWQTKSIHLWMTSHLVFSLGSLRNMMTIIHNKMKHVCYFKFQCLFLFHNKCCDNSNFYWLLNISFQIINCNKLFTMKNGKKNWDYEDFRLSIEHLKLCYFIFNGSNKTHCSNNNFNSIYFFSACVWSIESQKSKQ